ncbi:MAG: YdbL family protein [Thiogranum sp.]|nr:YdbL family protein [Thiogranum sp.]
MKTLRLSPLLSLLLIGACVTINVYFPTAEAVEAADRIIRDVYGKEVAPADSPPASEEPVPESSVPDSSRQSPATAQPLLIGVLEWLVPAAQAANANIDIQSPAVSAVRASMEARFPSLKPFFDTGSIGMTADGLLTVRDLNSVPLRDRKTVSTLVSAENKDRNTLYREIARANGHPEWEDDIRSTFAQRWVANAPSGWWYQDAGGNWKQK